jgi:hypothetical protein
MSSCRRGLERAAHDACGLPVRRPSERSTAHRRAPIDMTMSPALPVLVADGTLRIDALPVERRELEHLVVRGALIVVPERPLRALEELDVTIVLPDLANPLRIHCTVVILQPTRAVLKLDDSSVVRVEAAQRGPAKVGPPVLEGDVVRFAQEADLARAEVALCQHGFVMALPRSPAMDASAVRLALGAIENDVALSARILPHPSGSVAIQVADAAACGPIIADLRRRLIADLAARRRAAEEAEALARDESEAALAPVVDETAPTPIVDETTPAPVVDETTPAPVVDDTARAPVVDAPLAAMSISAVAPVPMSAQLSSAPFVGSSPDADLDDEFMPPPNGNVPAAFSIGSPVSAPPAAKADTSRDVQRAPAVTAREEPHLDDGVLRFPDALALDEACTALKQLGALRVLGSPPKRSPEARIRLASVVDTSDGEHDVLLMAGGEGHVIIQPQNGAALLDALDRLRTAAEKVPSAAEAVTVDGESHLAQAIAPATTDAPVVEPVNTTAPPRLVEGALHFDVMEHLAVHSAEIRMHGALLAIGRVRLGAEPKQVSVVVGGTARGTVSVSIVPMSEDTVVLMFPDSESVSAHLDTARLQAERTSSGEQADESAGADDASFVEGDTPSGLQSSGRFKNPTTAEETLRIPIVGTPSPAELAEPSIPLLLRVLLSTGRAFHILVEVDNSIHRFALTGGTGVRAMTPLSTLGRNISGPVGNYVVEPLVEKVNYKVKGTAKELLTEALRGLINRLSYDELPRPFAAHEAQCPNVPAAQLRTLEAIALTGTQTRLQKSALNGTQTLAEVLTSPAGARAVWETPLPARDLSRARMGGPERRHQSEHEGERGPGISRRAQEPHALRVARPSLVDFTEEDRARLPRARRALVASRSARQGRPRIDEAGPRAPRRGVQGSARDE